jgi:dipeptidyl aminopeptidase/acylaminoacyl peptidase
MSHFRLLVALICLLAAGTAAHAGTDEVATDSLLTVADFLDWERVSDPQISPDGKQIIYTRRWVNQLTDRWESQLWIMSADGARNRFLTKGSSARWAPDSTRIAYLAPGEPDGTQIFVLWLDVETPTQITRVAKSPGSLSWSPDGTRIAFVMRTGKDEMWKIDLPPKPEGAEWTKPPRVIEGIYFRQDRRGFMEEGYNHLFVVSAEGGTPRQLTHGDWHVGDRSIGLDYGIGIDWTPDGKEIIFDGLTEEDAAAGSQYRRSHIYQIEVDTRKIRRITTSKGPWSDPHVSPDGRWVAFVGFRWTPQTYHTSDIYIVGLDGQPMRSLTSSLDRDPQNLHWAPDGSGVYFVAGDRGSRNAYFAPSDGSGPRQITQGVQMLSLASLSAAGVAVGVRTTPHQPGDVVRLPVPGGDPIQQLTRINQDVLDGKQLAEVEEIWYESSDGTRIQGWIVKPPGFDPKSPYPLILHIHGGPHAMYNVGFNFSFQHLAASGFLVLYTNPRGSTGYGTDFGNAINNAYPSVDYHDLMAGVDALLARGWIDPDRLYVTGVSGGGVLSSWTIGHTDRFAAAAVRAPVINWISFAGTTDIIEWAFHRFDGYFWDNPDKWLAHSPLMYADKIKTPTLLMTGELDLRTPMSQTEELYQALNAVGAPARLVRFHEEYHGTGSRPSNFMRTQLYLIDWFNQHRPEDGRD